MTEENRLVDVDLESVTVTNSKGDPITPYKVDKLASIKKNLDVYNRGRSAALNGAPRDGKQSTTWLKGYDSV